MKKILVIMIMALSAVAMNAEVANCVWGSSISNPKNDYGWKYNYYKGRVERLRIEMEDKDPSSKEYMELKSELIKEEAEMNVALEEYNYLGCQECWVFEVDGANDSIVAYVKPNTSIDDFLTTYKNVKRLCYFIETVVDYNVEMKPDVRKYSYNLSVFPTLYQTDYKLCTVTVKTPNEKRTITVYDSDEKISKTTRRGKLTLKQDAVVKYINMAGKESNTPFEGYLNVVVTKSGVYKANF